MATIGVDRLPTAEDGVEGILALADVFGAEAVFQFIGFIRAGGGAAGGTGTGAAGEARAMLARQLVEDEGGDGDEARRVVAERLGYTTKTRTNFYKLVGGVPRGGRYGQ